MSVSSPCQMPPSIRRTVPASRHSSIQSQHSSFEDTTTVHPVRGLLLSIRDELDQETVHQLICISKSQLKDQYDEVVKECDLLELFNTLEKNYDTEHAVSFIETLLEYEELHGDCGSCKLADKVRQYKREKAEYLLKCQELGFPLDPYFVGREQIKEEVLQILKKPASECMGVLLHGQSGVGKSSLAREVCYRLRSNSTAWQITLVNLRDRNTLKEILHSLLLELANNHWRVDLDEELLRAELIKAIKDSSRCRQIIWLDNVDSLCETVEGWNGLANFLKELLNYLHQDHNCQMKFLITATTTLETNPLTGNQTLSLEPDIKVLELHNLNSDDAGVLLRKISNLADEVCYSQSLYSFTRGNPLALRMVGSLLRDGTQLDVFEAIVQPVTNHVEKCIELGFQALDKKSQCVLVKLSVFKTAKFCPENLKLFDQAEHKQDLLVDLSLLRTCNFVEKLDFELSHFRCVEEGKINQQFSIHPFILRYLKGIQESVNFTEVHKQAKICFCRHVCSLIDKYVRKFDSSDSREASKSILERNCVHFKTWYRYVMNERLPVDKFYENDREPLVLQYRVWRVAQIVLCPSEQLRFLQQQVEIANQSKVWFPAIVWVSFQAEYCIHKDQVQEATQLIGGVPEKFHTISPAIASDLFNTNRKLSEAEILRNIADTYSKEEQFGILVASAFYYKTYGQIVTKLGNSEKTYTNYLRLGCKLFSGKYGKSEVGKRIKKSFKAEIAKLHILMVTERGKLASDTVFIDVASDSCTYYKGSESANIRTHTPFDRKVDHNEDFGSHAQFTSAAQDSAIILESGHTLDPTQDSRPDSAQYYHRSLASSSSASSDRDSAYSSIRESCSSVDSLDHSSRRHAWLSSNLSRKRSSRDSQALSDCSESFQRDSCTSTDSFGSSIEIAQNQLFTSQGSFTRDSSVEDCQYLSISHGARRRVSLKCLESQANVTSLMGKLSTRGAGSFEEEFPKDSEMEDNSANESYHRIKRRKQSE